MHEFSTQQEAGLRLERTEAYLASDPVNPGLMALAMELTLETGDMDRAAYHAETARLSHPDNPTLQYRRAQVHAAQRKWNEAAEIFSALLSAHQNVNLACSLADCVVHVGDYAAASAALFPWRDDPALPHQGATLLVRAMHHMGQYRAAINLHNSFRDRFLDDPTYCAAASLLHLDAGEAAAAAVLAGRALTDGARPIEALVTNATLSLGNTDADLASFHFSEALEQNSTDGRCWSGLGMATMLRGDCKAAIPQLEQAVRFMPSHIGSWHALGWCHLLTQDLHGAEAAFSAALALDRNFGESHGNMAVIAAHKGQRARAQAAVRTALKLDAKSLSAHYAEMVMSGEAADPERFKAVALRLIGAYHTPGGESLAAAVERMTNA